MQPGLQPFSALTPDCVLNALDSQGLATDGRLLALNSYENRVYQAGCEDGPPVVVKFYRPGRWSDAAILEEHAFLQELAEEELPVVPPRKDAQGNTLHAHLGFRFAVFSRQGGHAPEFDREDVLRWMGRLIGRIHAVGTLSAYRHRPTLNLETFGREPRDFLLSHDCIPMDLREAYRSVVDHALERVESCYRRAGECRHLRLHGDCYAGNVLWTGDGPHFVDFDDSRMGPAIQDLWMLLSGDRAEQQSQWGHILAGYQFFFEFDARELNLIEALRTLRLIHHSAWLARRWDDPAFPMAFPWFATPRYWQERILELREQIALMDEAPLLLG